MNQPKTLEELQKELEKMKANLTPEEQKLFDEVVKWLAPKPKKQ